MSLILAAKMRAEMRVRGQVRGQTPGSDPGAARQSSESSAPSDSEPESSSAAEPTGCEPRIEVDLDLRAVLAANLDLVEPGAVAVLVLDLEDRAAAGRL